jgi:hypothetical protein
MPGYIITCISKVRVASHKNGQRTPDLEAFQGNALPDLS